MCGYYYDNEVTYHHVKSRGSWGHDEYWNLMPLCRKHHIQVHNIGLINLCHRYPNVKDWLISNNWELLRERWKHVDKE